MTTSDSVSMKTYSGQTLKMLFDRNSSAVFENFVFNNCTFDNCTLCLTKAPEFRSTVRNVRLANCVSFNSSIGPVVLEDVMVDGLKTNDLLIMWGPLFKHVTLKGRIGQININLVANFWDPRSEMQRTVQRRPVTVLRNRGLGPGH